MNKKAFTLIELLVVIAIIGVLMAVLLPALTKVRTTARQVQCMSNLKDIGVAFYLYLDDHNETFPPGGGYDSGRVNRSWEEYLYPSYIDNRDVFICHTPEIIAGMLGSVTYKENFYGYNGFLGGGNIPEGPRRLANVTKPSTTIVCADARRGSGGPAPAIGDGDFSISYRHSNGSNILFVSGAAQWFRKSVIQENIGGDDGGWWGWPLGGWMEDLF